MNLRLAAEAITNRKAERGAVGREASSPRPCAVQREVQYSSLVTAGLGGPPKQEEDLTSWPQSIIKHRIKAEGRWGHPQGCWGRQGSSQWVEGIEDIKAARREYFILHPQRMWCWGLVVLGVCCKKTATFLTLWLGQKSTRQKKAFCKAAVVPLRLRTSHHVVMFFLLDLNQSTTENTPLYVCACLLWEEAPLNSSSRLLYKNALFRDGLLCV